MTRLSRSILLFPVLAALGCATTESAEPERRPARRAVPTDRARGDRGAGERDPGAAARGEGNAELQVPGDDHRRRRVEAGGARGRARTGCRGPELAGKHGAGPTWTLNDGSGAKGDGAAAKKAPSPESGVRPLAAHPGASRTASPVGFQGVTFVQRIDTHGGAAPGDRLRRGERGRRDEGAVHRDVRLLPVAREPRQRSTRCVDRRATSSTALCASKELASMAERRRDWLPKLHRERLGPRALAPDRACTLPGAGQPAPGHTREPWTSAEPRG